MTQIPVRAYLDHALRLTPTEERLRAEFSAWLPDDIIDCHAHSNQAEHVLYMTEKTLSHMLSTFPYYSIEDSRSVQELLHPGKRIRSLRFPKTFRGIDHRVANLYLLEESPDEDRIALFGLPEDPVYTISMLDHPRVSALKMYYSYVDPTAKRIYEYFTPEILEAAQAKDVPIILHLPTTIIKTVGDLLQLLRDFPTLRVSLAHLGLSKLPVPELEEAFRAVAPYERLSLDTALNPSAEVVSLALRCFGTDRVMYGSDEPLHLIRSKAYRHPEKGERIVTDYLYHWVDPDDHVRFGSLAADAPHAHWQCLEAIRSAISALPTRIQTSVKEQIFHKNAQAFFAF